MRRISCLLILLLLACGGDAEAQTYVRPSKGKAIVLWSNQSMAAPGVIGSTSVMDWTAFQSAQFFAEVVSGGAMSACTNIPVIEVFGHPTLNATTNYATSQIVYPSAALFGASNIGSIWRTDVSGLSPFISVRLTINPGAGGTACSINIYVIPVPFELTQSVTGFYPDGTDTAAVAGGIRPLIVGAKSSGGTYKTLNSDSSGNLITSSGGVGSSTAETVSCNAGVSPCTVGTTATTLLAANTSRKDCIIQNVNATDFYCKRATSGSSAASTTNMDFMLKAASAANKGDGGSYQCAGAGNVWTGAINCTGSAAAGTLNVSGVQ